MRTLAGPVFAIATTLACIVRAGTDLRSELSDMPADFWPERRLFCVRLYVDGQCRLSASGRAAQCIINPYFAGANPGRTRRQHRIP